MPTLPHLDYEIELWNKGYTVLGMDEVGRGAFAGPLVVAGVIFEPTMNDERITKLLSYGINDSKKLEPGQRKVLSKIIQKECFAYSISTIPVAKINRIGIGKATYSAMREVARNLMGKSQVSNVKGQLLRHFLLIDGFRVKYIRRIGLSNQRGIIKGDSISLSIAAASIIAKVYRDNHMIELSNKHPEYMWNKNKGYGSLAHRNALRQYGKCILHRNDFVENFVS